GTVAVEAARVLVAPSLPSARGAPWISCRQSEGLCAPVRPSWAATVGRASTMPKAAEVREADCAAWLVVGIGKRMASVAEAGRFRGVRASKTQVVVMLGAGAA